MTLRAVAFVVGVALIAATAHVTVSNSGGYGHPQAFLTLAIAAGVAVGALAIGSAWNSRRRFLSGALLVAIVAGEAFGFLMTAERLVTGREAAQAPLRAADRDRTDALERVAVAVAAVRAAPTTSPQLATALAGKAAADRAAVERSAEMGCRDNCRQLLQAQVDSAEREVAAARAMLAKVRTAADAELQRAREVLAGMRPPASASPLADRLSMPAWAIDLLASALGSLAANGMGVALIAFAAHRRREEPAAEEAQPVDLTPGNQLQLPVIDAKSEGTVTKFLLDALDKEAGAEIEAGQIYSVYLDWCHERDAIPIPEIKFLGQFERICSLAGIETQDDTVGRTYAVGVTLKEGAVA